jgi:lipoprotein-releasing system permease protein
MRFELFIANRMKSGRGGNTNRTPSLNIAVVGMTMAIFIMLLSLMIVQGFKNEISNKLYSLDSHIKVTPFHYSPDASGIIKVDSELINLIKNTDSQITDVSLAIEKSVVLKTTDNFKGLYFKGVDSSYNWNYLNSVMVDGCAPDFSTTPNGVILSKNNADKLKLKIGDKIRAYFISESVKTRNLVLTGVYKSDLEDFDNNYILGDINLLRGVGGIQSNECNYIGLNCKDYSKIEEITLSLNNAINNSRFGEYLLVTNTIIQNTGYFTWLELLDMNVIVIIVIMLIVTSFTLIAGMLMIVLEKVNMIGVLKSMGSSNHSISKIFIYATNKLILKSMLVANVLAALFFFVQNRFHLVTLDAEAYYMSYVPVSYEWIYILLLNLGVVLVSYLTLLIPSRIVSSISPSKSIKF